MGRLQQRTRGRRVRPVSGALVAAWVSSSMMACVGDGDSPDGTASVVGFEPDLSVPQVEPEVSGDKKASVVALGRAVLDTYFSQGRAAALEVALPGAPEAMARPGPRLFATLRNQGVLRASYSGAGATFAEVVRSSVVRAIEDERFGGVLLPEEAPTTTLEFNAVLEGDDLETRTLDGLAALIEPGRHAFEFRSSAAAAFFKETVMITHNYGHEVAFQRLCEKAGLLSDCYTEQGTSIVRFRAEHWVEDATRAKGYYELFRSHRVVRLDDVTRHAVERAARANADYLRLHVRETGGFDYLYQPDADALVADDNTVRQAGASYAASKLASYFGEPEDVAVARAAVMNLLRYERTNERGSYLRWQRSSLGITGLALLGIVELEESSVGDAFKPAALRLARGIVGQQTTEGRLRGDFEDDAADTDAAQQYYPGEALLALARMLRRWPEEAWIAEALEASFDYYVDFWHEHGTGSFPPWHGAAWANAYLHTGDERYARFALELADWIVDNQNRTSWGDWEKDDYAGAYTSYLRAPPNFSTGTYSEPIPLAIEVARALGDEARVERYLEAQHQAMRFLLQLVISPQETFYMPSPERSLGGVRTSLSDNDVRIDGVQHVATAFVHALQYLDDEPTAWAMAAPASLAPSGAPGR